MRKLSRTINQHWLLACCLTVLTLLRFGSSYAGDVVGFTLINSTTNADIKTLTNGDKIDLRTLGNKLNIRVNTNPSSIGKVVMVLSGKENRTHTESEAPYSLFKDTDGDYRDWTPALGTYTLSATPYSDNNVAGASYVVTFTVVSSPADEDDPSSPPPPTTPPSPGNASVQGELKKWHKITLLVNGPSTSETASTNPFLNYRLNVTFTNGSKRYVVPGYYAADGDAGQTSAGAGNVWKVHFAPDEVGTWNYSVSMRTGSNIAVNDDAGAGSSVSGVDGRSGSFTVSGTDKSGSDLRAKGRLRYVGQHYLQFAETGEYFVKGGVDSPENFLAYDDFDNTPDNGGKRKSWSPHVRDWRSGDPTWKDGKGKGIIGAINYLASEGLNAFSFLTMNINGDDKNVYPYVSSNDFTRFDCSKLDQWETVFEHADELGLYLHFKLQERENCNLLDGGNLGTQRKLYFRELIARFGHHLALNWNMGEENIQTDQQRKQMADYMNTNDPYKHNIVLHTNVKEQGKIYTPLLGSQSDYTGVSIQTDWNNVYEESSEWVQKSASAGKKWIVANDEQNAMGVATDANYSGDRGSLADNQDDIRQESLWGNLMASGAGVEYYFGGSTGQTDLAAEDFRSRAKMWRFNRHALNFFKTYVPLTEVRTLSSISRGWMLGKEGELYIVYLKDGGSASITLSGNTTYSVQWYDPRNGGALQRGSVSTISGSGSKSIGNPPNSSGEDWVALIKSGSAPESAPNNTVYRLSAGGDDSYTTSDGRVFSKDSYSSGGSTYVKSTEITNTNDDPIYHGERYGNFSYNFPVSNGTYTVVLHFAEVFATGVGKRKFHVNIEGQRKLTDYDIFDKAGGAQKAVTETFTTNVTDGTLNIVFGQGSANNAKVSAIEVLGSSPSARAGASLLADCPTPYEEKNGLVVIETENLNLPSGWQKKTTAPRYTGSGYIDWVNAENFSRTGVGLIETTIKINKAGKYTFQWRNRVGRGTVLTEHNDTWLRFPDASDFYGEKGTRKVYPYGSGKTPNPNGAGGDGWFKVYFNAGIQDWAWTTFVSDRDPMSVIVEFNTPGVYKLQISARSAGHLLDRMVLYHSSVSASTAQALSNGETTCSGTTPVANRPPVVASPLADQTARVGTGFSYTFPANSFSDPDGDGLTYTASLSGGGSLPSWLQFNGGSRTFSGTPPSATTVGVRVTASDGRGGQISDDLTITVSSSPVSQQSVVSYSLINVDNGQEIRVLAAGDVLNLATLPTRNLNIRANTNPSTVGSVVMVLSGAQSRTQTETGAPYALFGGNDYNPWTPAVGSYTLTSTPYTSSGGTGTAGTPLTRSFTVINQGGTAPLSTYRVNAGGGSYTADGKTFSGDTYSSGGSTFVRNVDIVNTTNDPLYQTERYGNFSYNFPVSNGTYTVILHFAEVFATGTNQRKFNVDIEGGRKLTDYDIFAKAGGAQRGVQESFSVSVTDGTLNVAFVQGSVNNAKVSAIEVIGSSSARVGASLLVSPENGPVVRTYPNPTDDKVTIDGVDTDCPDLKVTVISGMSEFQPRQAIVSSGRLEVMLGELPTGLYILRISQCGRTFTEKVIVKH